MMRLSVIIIAVLLGLVSGPAFGEMIIYGPLTFETGNQGGSYFVWGPGDGDVNLTFPGDPGEKVLHADPTEAGSGLAHDTGFTTKLSSYTVSADGEWELDNRDRFSILGYAIPGLGSIGIYPYRASNGDTSYITSLFDETNPLDHATAERVEDWTSGNGYKTACFKAAQQASGDGTSNMNWANPHNIAVQITDTGTNSTSTFKYTWSQEVSGVTNTWVVEETFSDIRSYAMGEATDKNDDYPSIDLEAHVGGLFDTLVATARNSSENTGFCYYSFSGANYCDWDNTTVTAVPEPSIMVLLLCGLGSLLGLRRR